MYAHARAYIRTFVHDACIHKMHACLHTMFCGCNRRSSYRCVYSVLPLIAQMLNNATYNAKGMSEAQEVAAEDEAIEWRMMMARNRLLRRRSSFTLICFIWSYDTQEGGCGVGRGGGDGGG